MVFTSTVFLSVFLPALFALYFLANTAARPYVLLIFSLLFYAWGEPSAVLVMIALMIVNYGLGLGIGASRQRGWARLLVFLGVVIDLGALISYKYLGFFAANLVPVAKLLGFNVTVPEIALPIGISFYVFQILSYLVDVYRGTVAAQRNPFKFMLYVSLFPQLIAGPIVRYSTVAADIENRRADFGNIVAGIRRFAIGLAKKALIADSMASIVDVIFAAKVQEIPCAYCWLGAVAYALQIYFDFSGYSDMAIGLGRVFNFRLLENFDHPYASCSVQEFWRRWHISLSSWFRDYLYIPLGGNRKGKLRTYVNMFTVFFLCGLWHGAAWNFVVWGVYHGVGLVVERAGLKNVISKLPRPVANIYLMLFVIIGWVLFRAPDLSYAVGYLGNMFGGATASFKSFAPSLAFAFIDKFILLAVGCVAAYPVFDRMVRRIPEAVRLACGIVFFLAVYVITMTSGYSPFIYFRF